MNTVSRSLGRARALAETAIAALFGALLTYITLRMVAQGAGAFGIVLVGALALGLWWRAWRWYRRFRVGPVEPDGSREVSGK